MKKSCVNCAHFKMSTKPPRMRSCTFPGKIMMNGAFCANWKFCYSLIQQLKAKLTGKPLPARSFIL